MKRFIPLFFIVLSTSFLNAQFVNSDFQKLFDLYIMDKNEECYFQSLKRMEKDKFRTSPEVYFFAMRSSIKLLDDREFMENNPRLLKDALKYGYKYVKYKNKQENPGDFDLYYSVDVEKMRFIGLDEAEYYYHESKYRKAAYYAKKVYKLAPEDPRVQLILGLAQLTRRNTREGKASVEEGLKNLANEPSDKDENLLKKEQDIIYFVARAASIELVGMSKQQLATEIIETLSPVLTDKQKETLAAEFQSQVSEG